MPRGIKGYRWIETGIQVWQLEYPSGSRRFSGCVSENSNGWSWWVASGERGEASSTKQAKREVELRIIPDRTMILRGRRVALNLLNSAIAKAKAAGSDKWIGT